MELPNLGKQCQDCSCKQLDFLPYTCKCGQIFCSDHYLIHVKDCPSIKQHKEVIEKKIEGLYKCSHPECKETSLVPLICGKCMQHFCITHRHVTRCFEEDPKAKAEALAKIKAPIEQFNEAKAIVDKQVDSNIAEAKKKSKNTKMATQLQLMRIKNKATGSKGIPSADRVYFNVNLPKNSNNIVPVFVSQSWSLGRTIDAIADECKIPNRNNQGNNTEKLRLFKSDTGSLLSDDLSQTIQSLLNREVIVNGDSLTLDVLNES